MKTEKMKVLLYLKKSSLDKLGKAPITGRITLGRSIAQFSCKLSCNPDLWNSRESRMDGKSHEAVEINGRLENLLLSIQSTYQSLITKGQPFDATDVKELFQGSVQARCRLIERLDILIKEKESHIGIDIKEGSMSAYHSTRKGYRSLFRGGIMFRIWLSRSLQKALSTNCRHSVLANLVISKAHSSELLRI